jgi:hypothetical protein
VKYVDPDGKFSEITVDGNNITIIIPVEYAKGTTEKQKQEFKQASENYWTGQFGDKNVKLFVVEQNAGKRNTVRFKDDTTNKQRSFVVGSSSMTIFNKSDSGDHEWQIAHEVGHLMKLGDKYKRFSRDTPPLQGWEGNIMAAWRDQNGNRTNVELRNINEILDKNKRSIINK